MAWLVIAALVAFLLFGLSRWAALVRQHRADFGAGRQPEVAPEAQDVPVSAVAWLCLRGQDATSVARALGLRMPVRADWKQGIAAAQEGLFVAPPHRDFVQCLGLDAWQRGDLKKVEAALERLSEACGEAYWFVCDEARECMGWAAARRGVVLRGYCYDLGEERALWDFGEVTQAEAELGFFVADARDGSGDPVGWWPVARDVRMLAARWALAPTAVLGESGWAGRW